MDSEAYQILIDNEDHHWWFKGRRAVIHSLLESLRLPVDAEILEVGCGSGGNLAMLAGFGRVSAMEMDEYTREKAIGKTGGKIEIRDGYCPGNNPYEDRKFDLICLFDVLEHIAEDVETLKALKEMLKPGGRILFTVPAYQWLYGAHDRVHHHKRRYSAGLMRSKVGQAGLKARKITYFNTFLFPLAVAARILDRLMTSPKSSGTGIPRPPINSLFTAIFRFERHLVRRLNVPFGVSLAGVLEK